MNIRLKCEKPEDIQYTISITATAKEFEELQEQLAKKWPSFELSRKITDVLSQARRIYWSENE